MADTKKKVTKKYITRYRKGKDVKTVGVDTLKFCGIIHVKKDALRIQKELRNEWK